MYSLKTETEADFWEVEALFDLCFAPGREALSSYRLRDGVPPVAELSLVARDPEGILAGAIRYWPVRVGTAPALLLGPIAVHPTRQGEGLGGVLIRDSLRLACTGTGCDPARGTEPVPTGSGAASAGPFSDPPSEALSGSLSGLPPMPGAPSSAALPRPATLPGRAARADCSGPSALAGGRVLLVGDAPYYNRFGFTRLPGVVMPPPTNPARVLGRALIKGAWAGVTGDVRPAGPPA